MVDGSLIRHARRARGWNRERLAVECGVGYASICRLEQGRPGDVRVLVRVAEVLELSMDALLRRTSPEPELPAEGPSEEAPIPHHNPSADGDWTYWPT